MENKFVAGQNNKGKWKTAASLHWGVNVFFSGSYNLISPLGKDRTKISQTLVRKSVF